MTKQDIWLWDQIDSNLAQLSGRHKYLLYRAAKYFNHVTDGDCIEWCLGKACILSNRRYTYERIDSDYIKWLLIN